MVKLDYNYMQFTARAYFAHDFGTAKDIGVRLMYNINDLIIGTALLKEDFEEEESLFHYEFDAEYVFAELIEFSTQISNIDDGQDVTDDVKAYLMVNYHPGYKLPVVGNTRPYAGIDTRENLDENTVFWGLNFEPVKGGFIKIGYSVDTADYIDDRFDIQVAYVF